VGRSGTTHARCQEAMALFAAKVRTTPSRRHRPSSNPQFASLLGAIGPEGECLVINHHGLNELPCARVLGFERDRAAS